MGSCLPQARMKVGRSKTAARALGKESSAGLLLPAHAKFLYAGLWLCIKFTFLLQDYCMTLSPALLFNCYHSPSCSLGLSQLNFFYRFEIYYRPGTGPQEPQRRPSFFSCRGGKIWAIQTFCVQGRGRSPGLVSFIGVGLKGSAVLD